MADIYADGDPKLGAGFRAFHLVLDYLYALQVRVSQLVGGHKVRCAYVWIPIPNLS